MKNNTALRCIGLAAAVLLGGGWSSFSAQANNMSFHGRLIEVAPCEVNNNEDMQIDFGDIQVKNIDGVNYSNVIYFYLKCEGETNITMTHNGVATSFNKAAVQTNVANFGIQLSGVTYGTSHFTPLDIGVPFKLHEEDGGGAIQSTAFSAVPVKKPGAEVAAGVFNGVSTVQLEYP